MNISIEQNAAALGVAAGKKAAALLRGTLSVKGSANVILATGASQFETLKELISQPGIDWGKVTMFHLDEYIGLPETHGASFRKYLKERFLDKVAPLKEAVLVNGNADPEQECERLAKLIQQYPIDIALVGIGENGHLAFNDPPADFTTTKPYLVVNLDEPCRRQQMNEGWFEQLEDVPKQAISMSIKQIMLSKHIICSVPDKRKAAAVRDSLEKPVSNLFPASILQQHPDCTFFLDETSASLLTKEGIK